MTATKLHKIDFDLLKSIIDADVFIRLAYKEENYNYVIINASEEIIDIIQDQLISKLMEDGFDSNFNVNPFGAQLEALIDTISKNMPD